MHVLVLWSGSSSANLGVRVLAQGMGALAQLTWGPTTTVDFQDYGPGDSAIGFGGKTIIRDIGRRTGPIKMKLQEYDVVLDSGAGDSFADIYGLKRLLSMNYAHRSATRMKIPLVLGPQTIGPFNSAMGRAIGRDSLRRMTVALPRDSQSAAYMGTLGRGQDALATDVVFALEQPAPETARDVIVNVSGLLWQGDRHVDSAKYRDDVYKLVGGLIALGRDVTLLAHVLDNPTSDNDVPVVHEVASRFPGQVEVLIPRDLAHARSVIAASQLVIGSRMHACLNAISTGVPAIPWAYSRKFAPLMSDLGWETSFDLRNTRTIVDSTLELVSPTTIDQLRPLAVATRVRAEERLAGAADTMRTLTRTWQATRAGHNAR